jgi:hypothetical protein
MKTLKFRKSLAQRILNHEKTNTWRLFDDKDLTVGDEVLFLVWETKEEFAKAKLTAVTETMLGELTDEDWQGHEKFASDDEMYKTYSKYYNRPVDAGTKVKIIKFELL